MAVSYVRLIGFLDLFPGTAPNDKTFYAAAAGKDFIQKLCCHLLGHLRHGGLPDVDTFLELAFTDVGYDHRRSPSYNALKAAYDKLQRSNRTTRFHIISIEALLSLFIWTETEKGLNAQGTANGMVAMLRLIELLLLFNDDVLKNYQTAYESSQQGSQELQYHRLSLATAFPQHDLVNSDYAQLIFTQAYKLAKLLTFLEADDFKPLSEALLQHYECATKEEYLKAIGGAIFTPLKGNKAGVDTLQVGDWPNGTGAQFLSKLSVDTATLPTDQNDYKQLRETPLQDLQNGEYRVIYDLFLIKKAYNSLIFKLSELAKQIGMTKDFLGEIRRRFSEGVLLYDVLGECLTGQTDILMSGENIPLEREPDTYARSKKRVMLFESKDFYLTAKEKLSYDFDKIVAGLQKDGRLLKAV